MTPATLRIRLLGELDLRHGETPVAPLGSARAESLLAYRLHPLGPVLLCGPIFWPLADAPEILRVLRDFGPQAPKDTYDPANLFRLNANIPPTALVTAGGQDRVR
jgi:hypothetical protein